MYSTHEETKFSVAEKNKLIMIDIANIVVVRLKTIINIQYAP